MRINSTSMVHQSRNAENMKNAAILIEHQQLDLFSIVAKNLAAEAMVLSFRVNNITLYSDYISLVQPLYGMCAKER